MARYAESGFGARLVRVTVGIMLGVAWLAAMPAAAKPTPEAQADVYYERGAHALRTGDPEKAIEWLERALQLTPDNPRTLSLYSRALLDSGRVEEAGDAAAKLEAMDPNDPDVLFLKALTEYRQGNWIAAKDLLEKARELRPTDPRYRLFLGRAYQELGEDSNAEAELQHAAAIDQDYAGPAAYRMGILKLERNEINEARKFFREVQSIAPDSELAKSAALYMQLIEQQTPRRFSFYAKFGIAYDSNITLVGGSNLISSSSEEGVRGTSEFGLNVRVLEVDKFSLRAGVTSYISYHNKEHDFDIQRVRPWVLGTYKFNEWLAVDTRLHYEEVYTDFSHHRRTVEIEPAVRITPRPGWLTRIFYEHQDRNFFFTATKLRDRHGETRRFGVDQYVPLPHPFEWGESFLRLGYRNRNEAAQGKRMDNRSHEVVATYGAALPWDMFLLLDGSYQNRDHTQPTFFDITRDQAAGACLNNVVSPRRVADPGCPSGHRKDRITMARLLVRKPIGRNWNIEGYYRLVHWKSNTQEYDFTRHIFGAAATFRY